MAKWISEFHFPISFFNFLLFSFEFFSRHFVFNFGSVCLFGIMDFVFGFSNLAF